MPMTKLAVQPSLAGPDARRFWHPKIEMWPLSKLRPSKSNARTHPKKQRDKLFGIVRQCGFINPILVDEDRNIISGNLRKEVAEMMGLRKVPVIQITHLSDVEKRALALAENRVGLDAGWDRETLAAELGELAVLLPAMEIDLSITGFDIAETDLILADHAEPSEEAGQDQLPEPGPAVTRLHDLWVMGKHRLHCGDARDAAAYAALMRDEVASMVFTDPPYNVSVKKHARGRSADRFDEFAMASGEMSIREYQDFLESMLERLASACADGAIAYVCIDWRHLRQLLEAGTQVFTELKNICVWTKSNAGQGSFYRSQHEMVCVFKKGTGAHANSFELGQHGRSRTNVWPYAGVNTFKAGSSDEVRHPTVKPTRLVADAMLDCSRRGAIVLDAFMGSGTTIIAAETVGRRAYGMELDPRYVDLAVRRWQQFTGRDAISEETGQTFTEVEAARGEAQAADAAAPQAKRKKARKGGR